MDLKVQFPDPGGYKTWQDWANELIQVLSRMITPTPSDQYPIIFLREDQPMGTDGGTFTTGAWQKRTLNNEYDPVGICLLNNSEFIVPKGRYFVRASAPAYSVTKHQARLWNVTDGVVALRGTSEVIPNSTQSRSWVCGVIEPKQSTKYRLEHSCSVTQAGNGFGVATGALVETYSEVELWGLT